MSERINKLKEKIIAMKEEAIREEIEARSKAAAVLAEDFELDDIGISSGVTGNGKITVYRGIKELAALCKAEIKKDTRKSIYGDGCCSIYYFTYNGVRFEQMVVEAGDKDVNN